jgi:putative DNA methylase
MGHLVTRPSGIGVIIFANKETSGWEALLNSIWRANWIVTASWPIQTERESRSRDQARLQSSVHIVCRPRENFQGSLRTKNIGDWRDVLAELPKRIHEWMPRLAQEGIIGADAIFACLGPALEIFSRYSCVEKASGEAVTLREYLEHVWAAVSNEALSMIFKDADAASLEPDARLTAMWLWTLGAGRPGGTPNSNGQDAEDEDNDDEEIDESDSKAVKGSGFTLEFDAARKIAQGLGVHLEKSQTIAEIKGDKARLLPVAERTRYLFGKGAATDGAGASGGRGRGRQKKPQQQSLFAEIETPEAVAEGSALGLGADQGPQPGATVLDRVHQAMLLFAAGRGDALKRFLVEDGIGQEARFWKLAQSLSALYPPGTDEKRWIDGVLARKKGLGL